MRHRKGFKQLSRKTGHRKAMMANMAASLIKHKRITTTTAKAKALRGYIEPLITKSKDDTTHSRRVVFSYLQDKDAVTELFREVSPKIIDRPGGYTRILKLETRVGDNAEMAMIELVDFNENLISETSVKSAGTRRRKRGGAKKKDEVTDTAGAAKVAAKVPEAVSDVKEPSEDIQEAVGVVEEETGEVEEVTGIVDESGTEIAGDNAEEEKQNTNESEEKKDS